MNPSGKPDLKRAFSLLPTFERAVRDVSSRLSAAKIRHVLIGELGANAYSGRAQPTSEIVFLVGDEAFESHAAGFVTARVPIIEVNGIDVDQVPLTDALRVVEHALDAPIVCDGVPVAPVEAIVIMKLLAGRHRDLADVEEIIDSGADRELLRAAVREAVPDRAEMLERLFQNIDERRD